MHFGTDKSIKLTFFVFLIISLFLQTACAQTVSEADKNDVNKMIETVSRLRAEGKYEEALKNQLEIVSIVPDDAQQQVVLASVYFRLKDYKNAKLIIEKAVAKLPDDP